LKDPLRLSAAYLRLQFQVDSNDGQPTIIPPEQTQPFLVRQGGMLQVKVVERETVFPLNTVVRMAKEDVRDILFTCNNAALELRGKLFEWIKSLGFEIPGTRDPGTEYIAPPSLKND
jgi:hypothetical protein